MRTLRHEYSFQNKFLVCFGKDACSWKTNHGQLAVGLAFAFAGILAMFGLVYNISLNTNEKIKLQTTSDYAALKVSIIQAQQLNEIRKINQDIEAAWQATNIALQPSFCSVNALVNTQLPQLATLEGVTAVVHKQYADCDSACDAYDQYYRDKLIKAYTESRNLAAQAILTKIQETNEYAFDNAVDTFLSPKKLPNGLYIALQQQLGRGFTLASVKGLYKNGQLSNNPEYSYQILEESAKDPLFIPQNEERLFSYINYGYQTSSCGGYPQYPCCIGGWPAGAKTSLSNSRITRATDYTTHFFTGIKYVAPLNVIQKMVTVGIKNPDVKSKEFGKNVEDDPQLFANAELQGRTATTVMSAAKPYGGTFPKAAFIADITGLSGTAGDEFARAKLFGIADKQEIGDQRIFRADGCLPQKDEFGNDIGCVQYFAEDFLH